MNGKHKIIRELLGRLPLPEAKEIIYTNLPQGEREAIYYADCERETLMHIGDFRLQCSEAAVKKYRARGYQKLSALYFDR